MARLVAPDALALFSAVILQQVRIYDPTSCLHRYSHADRYSQMQVTSGVYHSDDTRDSGQARFVEDHYLECPVIGSDADCLPGCVVSPFVAWNTLLHAQ